MQDQKVQWKYGTVYSDRHLPSCAWRRSMGGVGYFSAVSNVVQHMLTEVFNDESFMEEYFAENSRRLGAAYAEFTGMCPKGVQDVTA